MKCDELEAEQWLDYRGEPRPCYPQNEVDSAIDELKMEHHRERDEYISFVNKLQKENAELKRRDTEHTVHIAKMNAELRKTQRALWLDRAIRAEHMKNLIFEGELIYHDDNGEELDWRIMYRKWERAEAACRAKAKEYE